MSEDKTNQIAPSSVLAFKEALDGGKGALDAWLECNNEAEARAHVLALLEVERERCGDVVRYWLTGPTPATGTHEARCLAHVLDGLPAPAGWTGRANDQVEAPLTALRKVKDGTD